MDERSQEALIELLADYAHLTWAGWMQYMLGKCTHNDDGTMTIPAWAVTRWTRQMHTPYLQLPEEERELDRDEARRILGRMRVLTDV